MFIITVVLLFLIKIRFPKNQPISNILRRRYGVPLLKNFRTLENATRKLNKARCDLEFLQSCLAYEVAPKFLRIKLYRRSLETSSLYKSWQTKLLQREISSKQRACRTLQLKIDNVLEEIRATVSSIDFSCLKLWIERNQRSFVDRTRTVHEKKLNRLGISLIKSELSPKTIIHNLSDRVLTGNEEKILMLGLDFGLPIRKLNFFKYHLVFENLFSKLDNINIHKYVENPRQFFKTGLKSLVNKYFANFKPHRNICPVFSREDFATLRNLSKDKSIYITRPDKGNGVVILNKNDYITKIMEIIGDYTKFREVQDDERKLIIRLEDKLNNNLRSLKSQAAITEEFYSNAFKTGSSLGQLYGLPKTHKEGYPVRPILSAYNTHNYNLAKLLIPLISDISVNDYTVRNSYDFVTDICKVPNSDRFYMCSFDIKSLYTNVPVNETIDLIINNLFTTGTTMINGLNASQFRKLLNLSLNDTYFKFNNSIYKQLDGLAMGSPLSPVAANIFLNFFETSILNRCPSNIKPSFYKRYLDDTFLLFNGEQQARDFFEFINSQHNNIKFTFEGENDKRLSFLDVCIFRDNNSFSTSVYRKPTFSGLGTNFFSNIYHKYKSSSLSTLINRAYKLSSSFANFHQEIEFLRVYFVQNSYPTRLFNRMVKQYLNNVYKSHNIVPTVPKRILYLELPYIGFHTNKLKHEVNLIMSKYFPHIQPRYYFRNSFKISSFFRKYDTPPMQLRASVVYKYTCDCCQHVYIGSTVLQMFRRYSAHQGVSFRTGKHLSNPEKSAIREHSETHDHPFKLQNFSVIDNVQPLTNLRTLESLYIYKCKPQLNDMQSAMPLNTVD